MSDEYDKAKKWLGVSASDIEPRINWEAVARDWDETTPARLIEAVMIALYQLRVRTYPQQISAKRKKLSTNTP